MESQDLFYVILLVILANYLFESWLSWLNSRDSNKELPQELKDVYDQEKYEKAKHYERVRNRFSLISSTFSLITLLVMLGLSGFSWLHYTLISWIHNPLYLPLAYFGVLVLAVNILNLPFTLYSIFVIEERFGFNKTTLKTFILDKLKAGIMTLVLGGGLMLLFIWFYQFTGPLFWLWTWLLLSVVVIIVTAIYASLILPIFNKLTPLPEGELRSTIEQYANGVDFKLDNIFVMDGSRRSSKANAFFSGIGHKKRIVLYDNLVDNYKAHEITAVLAHEIGHYQKKHTLSGIVLSIAQTGLMLFLLSVVINRPEISMVLGVQEPSFHINLLVFSFLYAPFTMVIGIIMNWISRKNEFEADNFAKKTHDAEALIAALKQLTVDNLGKLTPHPYYIFVHYSHPTLLQRIQALRNS